MKTRIISAAIGIVLFIAILIVSTPILLDTYYPVILSAVLSILAGAGVYEILHNTGIVKNPVIVLLSILFSAGACFLISLGYASYAIILYIIFVAVLLAVSLFMHEQTNPTELASSQAYSLFLAYAFASMDRLLREFGFFAFLMVFVFAWASDTFAYFTGVFLGKHKLCPKLSPKKTIEGAVGGILGCVAASAVASLIYRNGGGNVSIAGMIPAAVVFSLCGMVGDISASYIKRHSGIKDYGNIMPGHGGVLDRFDSVLFIAPLFYALVTLFPIF